MRALVISGYEPTKLNTIEIMARTAMASANDTEMSLPSPLLTKQNFLTDANCAEKGQYGTEAEGMIY